MIPVKGKKYMLNCQGPYDYNRYAGEGICTGQTDIIDEETIYGFKIPGTTEICYFLDKEIIAEFTDDNQVRPLICDPKNYPEDDESPYCEKCDSCGETGCCPPINCEAVKSLRLKGFHETQERNSKLAVKNLQKKIQDRDIAIDNLRGFISYLESRIVELKIDLGDYQD